MTAILLFIALAVVTMIGRWTLATTLRHTALYWFERWSLAFVIGAGVSSLLWAVLSPLSAWLSPLYLLTALAALLGIMGLKHKTSKPAREPLRAGEIMLAGLLILEFLCLFWAAHHTSLGWDGLYNFELKARLVFENRPSGLLPIAYISDTSRAWSHPAYPLLVPFMEYWCYAWLGRVDQSAVKLVFPLFYLSLTGIACGAVRRRTSRVIALGAGVTLGLMPAVVLEPGAISGYADVPLAAAVIGATSFAGTSLATSDDESLLLAAVLAAIGAWTKAEGLLLALCLGFATFVVANPVRVEKPSGPRLRSWLLVAIPIVALAPWLVIQQRYGVAPGDFARPAILGIGDSLRRLPSIALLVVQELMRFGHWGLLWPAFVCALFAMIWSKRYGTDAFLATMVVVSLAAYTCMFMFSAWDDVREHVRWSIARLLVPLAPIALLFTVQRIWIDVTADAA